MGGPGKGPRTRNYLAYLGRDHYCPHCLNSGPRGGCGEESASGGGKHSRGIVAGTYPDSGWNPQDIEVNNVYQPGQVVDVEIKMNAYHAGFFQLWLYTNPGAYDGADIDPDRKADLERVPVHCIGDGAVPAEMQEDLPGLSGRCCYYSRSGAAGAAAGSCPGGLTPSEFQDGGFDDADFYSMWWLPGKSPAHTGFSNTSPPYSGNTADGGDGFGRYNFPVRMPNANCAGLDNEGRPRCVLQWWWMTNNSCIGWTIPETGVTVANPTMQEGVDYVGWNHCSSTHEVFGGQGEQFWNCADVNIEGSVAEPTPTPAPIPTPAPTLYQKPKGPVYSNFTCLPGYVLGGAKKRSKNNAKENAKLAKGEGQAADSRESCEALCLEQKKCGAYQFQVARDTANCTVQKLQRKSPLVFQPGAFEEGITACWRTKL